MKTSAPEYIIRIHGPRTANGVFIEDMVNAKEIVDGEMMHLHLLTFSGAGCHHPSRSDDVYSMLPGSFRIEEVLEKSDLKVSAARMMISRWVKKGMVKKLEGKRGCEVWRKEK